MKEIKPRPKPVLPTTPAPPAEDLERSYQEAMRRLSGEERPATIEEPATKIPKKERAAASPPRPRGRPPKAQKRGTEMPVGSNRPGRHRLTIDLPDDVFELCEAHKEELGQSFTWLVTKLLREFFAKKAR